MRRGAAPLIVAVAFVVGLAGAVEKADHMTMWVIELCSALPAWAAFQVFHLPPPMDAWGLRPLSLLVMQGYLALLGEAPPPVWLIALKAISGSLALGFAARAWLRSHGFDRIADLAAAMALLGSGHLFSSWYLTELDAWGAAALLGGMTLLRRPHRLPAAFGLLAAALLLKESSALVLFAFLSGSAVAAALHRRWALAARYTAPLLLGALSWLALAGPLLGADAPTSVVGRVPLALRLPILEHNAAQLVHLATPAGAILLLVAGLLAAWPRRRGLLAISAVIVLLLLPIIARYAHYETIYHAPRAASLMLSGGLLFGLFSAGVLGGSLPRALLCAPVAATQVVMAAAVLGSSSLREDFAARLFLATAPLMLALALDTLVSLWRSPPARPAAAILAAALFWGPVAGAFNQIGQWRARQQVDHAGRDHIARQAPLSDGDVVIFNNFQEWLGEEELVALGLEADIISFPVPAMLSKMQFPEDNFGWTGREVSLEERIAEGEATWLYWLATRSTMSPRANAALVGDLSWTRRPLGALTPLAWGRREDETALPMHNFAEDAMLTTYHDGPTPLEQLTADGQPHFKAAVSIVQLPPELLSIPRRLLAGAPIVETYEVQARLVRLDAP
jgi:hypothetical protein